MHGEKNHEITITDCGKVYTESPGDSGVAVVLPCPPDGNLVGYNSPQRADEENRSPKDAPERDDIPYN